MRLVVLATSYPRFPGDGAAPFVQSNSKALAQLGHEAELITPHDPAVRESPSKPPRSKLRGIVSMMDIIGGRNGRLSELAARDNREKELTCG